LSPLVCCRTVIFQKPTAERVLCRAHPQSLRGLTLLEAGPEHAAAWTHLSELITAGQQDAFGREVGESVYTYAEHDSSYDAILDEGLRTYARLDHPLVVEALAAYDFSGITHLCDVGGGHGLTLGSLLVQHPHLRGTVLERPRVLAQPDAFWAAKLGVGDRCTYVSGDMFHAVPPADAYLLKRILHNWNDAECGQILSTIHRAAPSQGRVFIIEHIVPGPDTPHFAKLCDLQMLVLLTGRERTLEEYTGLLAGAGWTYRQTWCPASKRLGVVEAVKA
jgi:O-methyltransferase domain